jgi:hypothetical protein
MVEIETDGGKTNEVASLNIALGRLYNNDMSTSDTINAIYHSEEFSSVLADKWIFYAIAGTNTPCICCSWYVHFATHPSL